MIFLKGQKAAIYYYAKTKSQKPLVQRSKVYMRIKIKKITAMILLTVLSVTLLSGCSTSGTSDQKISKQGFYFDTIIQITLYGTSDEAYIDECFKMAKKYENMLSNTVDTSEVSKINASAGSSGVDVSDDTLELIKKGIEYGDLSSGKFDITIGKLSDMWNFSEIAENSASDDNEVDASVIPSDESIQTELSHVDYHNIQIDGNNVMLTDPDAKLDLGGIAKGYIADKMKEYLQSKDITSGIINLGGNVLTIGEKSDGSDYTVGIQKPFDESGSPVCTVKVKDKSIVTSGIYERYYKVNGKIYHHILDTDTGYPVENDLYSVTIISDSSCDGDALSTTCFALGIDKATELINSLSGVEAIFVTDDYKIITTSDTYEVDEQTS